MSSKIEKRVELIKNLVLKGNREVNITPKDVKLTTCESKSSNATGASFINALSYFIKCGKIQEQGGNEIIFLSIRQRTNRLLDFVVHDQLEHQIVLDKSFLEWACSILPKVFLEIRVELGRTVFHVASNRDTRDSLKRLELHGILAEVEKNGEPQLTRGLFYHELHRAGQGGYYNYSGECTFSITIGWEEAKENAINIGTKTIVEIFFKNEETKDLTIVVGNGTEIKCHKMIFAAQSSVLSKMVSSGMKESTTGVVELRENSEDGVKVLLEYLYGLEVSFDKLSCDVVVELFKTAHKYNLAHLQNSLSEFLFKKCSIRGLGWFTPDVILELYFYIRNLDAFSKLLDHSLHIMSMMNPQELRSCEGFQSLDHNTAFELFVQLMEVLQKGKKTDNI